MDGFIALYIFMLAVMTAYEICSKVPNSLHLPLISGTSFINGIVLIGAMLVMGNATTTTETIIGFIAVMLAAANIVGSYVITSQALTMFNKNNNNNDSGDQ